MNHNRPHELDPAEVEELHRIARDRPPLPDDQLDALADVLAQIDLDRAAR